MKSVAKTVVVLALALLTAMPAMALPTRNFGPTGYTAYAGFTGLPLRNRKSFYGDVIQQLSMGQQLTVLSYDGTSGWSFVEVQGTGLRGFVHNENIY